jgi:S1-C subfamily serine protease
MTRNNLLAALLLSAGFVGGVLLTGRLAGTTSEPAPVEVQTRTGTSPALGAASGLPDLSTIAERAVEASVNISSTTMVRTDPFLQFMYGMDPVRPQTSLGSGVLVSTDGLILTNSHVVGTRNPDIRVTLADKRELPATVVGIDPDTDLAVLRVKMAGGKPLAWGDSSTLRVAEWVIAVGNPFQFSQTVTLGIVSAVNRHDPQLATYNDFIQTDAAINPGNSGGALVNARGELVGINTQIYSSTGGYQGIGFAIPANLARSIMDQLVKDGEIVRGSIGNLDLRTITADEAAANGLGNVGGVLVYNMYRSDPAYRAGIVPYDIIVAYNGKPVREQSELKRMIADTPIGSTARVDVIRRGQRRMFEVPVVRRGTPQRRM